MRRRAKQKPGRVGSGDTRASADRRSGAEPLRSDDVGLRGDWAGGRGGTTTRWLAAPEASCWGGSVRGFEYAELPLQSMHGPPNGPAEAAGRARSDKRVRRPQVVRPL
jgi:hypothetical protein